MNKKIFLSAALFLLAVVVAVPTPQVFAEKPEGVGRGEMMRQNQQKQQGQERTMEGNVRVTSETGRTRACHAKVVSIKNRMSHLTRLATMMETNFDKHAQRVEDYYTNKVVPSGETVENYDSLVANIQTKKTAVQTALATAQTNADSFTCTSSAPKTQVTQFRQDMQAVQQALKEYRTAIKDLIVAVRSVTGDKGSPTPIE